MKQRQKSILFNISKRIYKQHFILTVFLLRFYINSVIFTCPQVTGGTCLCPVHGSPQPGNSREDEVSLLPVCYTGHKRGQVCFVVFFFNLFHCCVCFHLTSVSFSLRALNEMWKCQNMLRNHVKDLLDLVKKPKVGLLQPENVILTESCLLHFLTILLFYVHYLQSETSSKAVFAKVMVITSK